MKPKEIYKIAGRKKETVEFEGITFNIVEPSLSDRLAGIDLFEGKGEKPGLEYGFLVSRCCEELKGEKPEDIMENISADLLLTLGNAITNLVTKKKP